MRAITERVVRILCSGSLTYFLLLLVNKSKQMKINLSKRSYAVLTISLAALLPMFLLSFVAPEAEPWSSNQLMEPADLAATINHPKSPQPIVISVGPGAVIKGSRENGPASDKANLKKLENELRALPKDANIVIYCGCCPFAKCPNIRPAFTLLNKMGFKNQKLLNLSHNVKTDWIDRGYPVSE